MGAGIKKALENIRMAMEGISFLPDARCPLSGSLVLGGDSPTRCRCGAPAEVVGCRLVDHNVPGGARCQLR